MVQTYHHDGTNVPPRWYVLTSRWKSIHIRQHVHLTKNFNKTHEINAMTWYSFCLLLHKLVISLYELFIGCNGLFWMPAFKSSLSVYRDLFGTRADSYSEPTSLPELDLFISRKYVQAAIYVGKEIRLLY